MPSAVAATVTFLKTVGLAVGGLTLSAGQALALGAATVVAGAVAAQKLITELYKVPSIDSDRSRQATVRGTVEPQKLIYGEALVSGPISFVGVSGTDNRDLYHSIVLAGHPSDSISDIYFDDERIQSAHINASGNVTTGTFGPKDGTTICVIRKLTGSQTTADSVLDGAFFTINSSEHIGTNLTYIVTKFTLTDKSQETWDKFMPNDIKALVKGKKVYDPRQDSTSTYYDANVGVGTQRASDSTTWEWSENPVWCLVDYLTDNRFGMGIALNRIDLGKAVDAADICDATVSVPGGATEKRYTCNGVIFGTTTHKTNINKLLSSMNGMLTYTNGNYVIRAGAFESVGTGMTLTEDHMIGPVKLKTSFERNERFNTITGTFIDPSKNYKEIEFPKVQITSALTRDNNEELTQELKLSMTNSRYMAQRIAHKLIQLSDLQKVLTFPTNLAGVNISVGDRVNVTLSEFGYTNKTFVCLGWTLSESGTGGVNLTLREDDSSSYADLAVSGYSTVTPAGGIQQGFFGVPDPSGLSATAHVESIELDWTNPANMTGIIAIEVFASPNSSWSSAVKIGETIGTQFIHDESNGVDSISEGDQRYYWVRARRFPSGEGSDAVSDRNPDSDTSTVQATKGALGALADQDTVGDGQIDDNAVGQDQIEDGAVGTDQIEDDAVTVDKIANTLESTNYVAGTSGWRLTTAGDFEAGDGDFRGTVKATVLDVEDANVHGTLTATNIAAGIVTADTLAADVFAEFDDRYGGSGGFYRSDNSQFFDGSATKYVALSTVTHDSAKSIRFQCNLVHAWGTTSGYGGTNGLKLRVTFEYSADNTTWAKVPGSGESSNDYYERSATATVYSVTSAFDLAVDIRYEMTGSSLSDNTAYYFRVKIEYVSATNAFTSAAAGSANGVPVKFNVQQTAGLTAAAGDADTVDGLQASQFLRSDTSDTFSGNLTVTGNLTVQGSQTQLDTQTLTVEDNNIVLNYSTGDSSGSADDSGITIQDAVNSSTDASLLWKATGDYFQFSHPINAISSASNAYAAEFRGAPQPQGPSGMVSNGVKITAGSASTDTVLLVQELDNTAILTINGFGQTTFSNSVTIDGQSVTGTKISQWNTAYTYSQVGHLPLAGGTMTGTLNMGANAISSTGTLTSGAITASGPVSITGNSSYVGNYGYSTLVLQDGSGYAGINFRHGNKNWLIRKHGTSDDLQFVYSDNASAAGTGTYTELFHILHDGGFDFKSGDFSNVGAVTTSGDITVGSNRNINLSGDLKMTGTDSYIWVPNTTNGFTGFYSPVNGVVARYENNTNGWGFMGSPESGYAVKVHGAISAADTIKILASAGSSDSLILDYVGDDLDVTSGTGTYTGVIRASGYKVDTTTVIASTRRIYASNGTVAKAAFSFDGESNTGMYKYGTNQIGFTAGGTLKAYIQDVSGSAALVVSGQINASGGNSGLWNTAYGWGDHSTAGYLTGSPTNLSVSGYLNIGTRIGTVSPGLSITGDSNSSPIIAKSAYDTMSILPWDNVTYIAAGTYYDDGSWVHASSSNESALLGISGNTGGRWYASTNGTGGSWNTASNVQLWNNSGVWVNAVATDSAITSGGLIKGTRSATSAHVDYLQFHMPSWSGHTGYLKSQVWHDGTGNIAAIGAEYDGSKTNIHFHSQYNSGYESPADKTFSVYADGNVNILKDLKINSTTRIAQSGNATLGTISSGAITSSGALTTATGVIMNTGNDKYWVRWSSASTTGLYYRGTGGEKLQFLYGGSERWGVDISGNMNAYNNITAGGSFVTATSSSAQGIYAGSTQVFEGSTRNLKNIGSINSGSITSSGAITGTTVKETDGGDGFTEIGTSNFGYFNWGIEIANPNSGYRAIRFAGKKKYFVLEADVLGAGGANHTGMFWGNADGTSIYAGSTTGYKTTHQNSTSFHIRDINTNSNQETYNPGFSPADGAWHHQKIMATPDGYVRIWIDGDLKFEETGYIPSAEGYLGFINYAGTVRFANIRCRTINEDEAQHYSQHIGNGSNAYANDDRFIKLANNTAGKTGTLVTADNGNTWLNADGGKDLWLNWVSLNNKSSKADLQVGDGNYGAAILTVAGSSRRVGINNYNPAYDLDVIGSVGVVNSTGISLKNNSLPSTPVSTEVQLFEENNGLVVRGENTGGADNFIVRDKTNNNRLEVQGNGLIRQTIAGNLIDGTYYSGFTMNITGASTFGGLRFDRNGTANYRVGLRNDGKFQIANFNLSANVDDQFVISAGGDVGISTGTPAAKLEVVNAGTVQSQFSYNATNYTQVNYDGTNTVGGDALFRRAGSEKLRLTATGATITGQLALTSLLNVEDIKAKDANGLNLQTDEGTKRLIVYDNGEVVINETGSNADFRVESAIDSHMLFLDAGSNAVGFGESAPYDSSWGTASATRQVAIRGSNYGVLHIRGANAGVETRYSIGAGGGSFYPAYDDVNQTHRLIYSPTEAVFNTDGLDYDFRVETDNKQYAFMVNAGTDRVGINTSNPASVFGIKQDGNGYSNGLTIEDYDSSTRSAIAHVNGTFYLSADGTNDTLYFSSAGDATFSASIDAGGRIKATNWLELESAGAAITSEEAGIRIDYNDTAAWYIYKDNSNDAALHIQSAAASGEGDGTPRVRFSRTTRETFFGGHVGINRYNINSGYQLDVNGAIRADTYALSGTTVIDSTRNLTNIASITTTGTMGLGTTPNSTNYLLINRVTGNPNIKSSDAYLLMDSNGGMAGLNWYSSDRVVLANGGGNVGIGSSGNHTQKLYVAGAVRATLSIRADDGFLVSGTSVISASRNASFASMTSTGLVEANNYQVGGQVVIDSSRRFGANVAPNASYAINALQNGSLTRAAYFQANGGTGTGLEINATAGTYSGDALYVRQSTVATGGNLARFANSSGDVFAVTTGGSVDMGGTTVIASTRRLYASSGTSVKAAYSFDGDSTTGMYRPAASEVAFIGGGSEKLRIKSTGELEIPNGRINVDNGGTSFDALLLGGTTQSQYTNMALYSNSGQAQIWKSGTAYTSWGGASAMNIYNSNGKIAFHPAGTSNVVQIDTNSLIMGAGKTISLLQASGTLISHGAYSDAIGFNGNYGTYMGGNGGRYVYSGGANTGNGGTHPYYSNGSTAYNITHDGGQINNTYQGQHEFDVGVQANAGLRVTGNNDSGPQLGIRNQATGGTQWQLISNGSGNTDGAGRLQLWNTTQGFAAATFGHTADTATNFYNRKHIFRNVNIGLGLNARPPGSIASYSGKSGLFWHSDAGNDYGIYRTNDGWSSPNYSQIEIRWPTGIILDGGSSYGKSGVNIANGPLKINGTQMIDSARNITNIATASVADGGSIKLYTSSQTSGGQIHMPRAGHISFYGDSSSHHAICSRNQNGAESDDIRINSYADVWINLDSNNNNDTNADFVIGRHGGGTGSIDYLLSVSGADGDLVTEGNVTAYGSPSDIRLKENVERIADPIDKVKQLDGITFNYKKDGSRSTGLVAQQLLEVLPEVVYETEDLHTGDTHYAVRYGQVVGLLVEAVKELTQRIEELENGNNEDN